MPIFKYAVLPAMLAAAVCVLQACGENAGEAGDTTVVFSGATQNGGVSGLSNTTSLTLTFSVDPATLTAAHISIDGATIVGLTGSGTTRTLTVTNISVDDDYALLVTVADPPGYKITGSPQAVTVYRALYVGMPYQGGIIAYLYQSGDPGHEPGVPHGLIAAESDQTHGARTIWCSESYRLEPIPGGTSMDLGTGFANTENILALTGSGEHAAGLARSYNGGGFSDWHLPSLMELNKLYDNRDLIGGFEDESSSDCNYWSSTGYNTDIAEAWSFHGACATGLDKTYGSAWVRAVRYF